MNDNDIRISAIVCTHNRASLLDDALASLAHQTLAPKQYEVIVVDNASSDHTRVVAEKWIVQCANVRYFFEPQIGLSHARNRGVAETQAPIVAYMDDDCIAEPNWLAGLVEGFRSNPNAACIGGRVHLNWAGGTRPDWIPRDVLPVFASVDHGDAIQEMKHANGCNMAWDRRILLQLGGFRTELGRQGSLRLAGEESALQRSATENGFHIYYAPSAIVFHYVPIDRQSRKYILETCFMVGVSSAIGDRSAQVVSFFASLKQALRRIWRARTCHVQLAFAILRKPCWPPQDESLYWLCLCAISWGSIVQSVRYIFADWFHSIRTSAIAVVSVFMFMVSNCK